MLVLLSFLAPAVAQTPSATTASPAPAKPAAKKAAPKAKPVAKQPVAVESGPCRLGVISVIGERYSVQKFGLTIFESEETEIPIDWGLDDLVFARVKAATGGDPGVRRIAYPKGAFEPFYNPKSRFIPDPNERLPAIVRGITPNGSCASLSGCDHVQGRTAGHPPDVKRHRHIQSGARKSDPAFAFVRQHLDQPDRRQKL
ncbi:hypothetical protein [Bradyrhizobium sp. WSM1253]|uniref:hypothetical protein n=1 Tax=Bradyrhizobium sp. WSM1253 TaxID=319003 RepID=UPI0002E50E8E|nr:hypothetical protein [Bradyrhizobium sp. WSM1253]